MSVKLVGFQRKLHHTRYARKSRDKAAHIVSGAHVVSLIKDGKYPVRELAEVKEVKGIHVFMTLLSGPNKGQPFTQNIEHVDALLETEWEQTAERVAKGIAKVEANIEKRIEREKRYVKAISNFLFVPAGRILTCAGDDSFVTLFNCYVTDIKPPKGQEHFGRDSRQAIFYTMGKITEIMARGGGNGSCLSVLRPKYADLSQTKGKSAGAVHTGNMISSLTDWVEQANRRGAQMLTLHIWHPDVFYTADESDSLYNEDFIGAKNKEGFMEGNNSSVLITDAFMYAVQTDSTWDLVFPDTKHPAYNLEWDGDLEGWKEKGYPVVVYRTVKAREVWEKLVHCNWKSAEPGIIFIDQVNKMHNGWYLGKVKTTNPCGEQPILDGSTCNLGAVNWSRMLKIVGYDEIGPIYDIDWNLLRETVWTGMEFLDDVIDASYYFDKDLEYWQKGERRVGLGGMGVADFLIMLRLRYGSEEANETLEVVQEFIRDEAYKCSIAMAKEKGPFPFFDAEKYLESGFVKTLPGKMQDEIRAFGIRNLTSLTYAPTGTTGSTTPSPLSPEGTIGTGCEPHYSIRGYDRLSRVGSTTQVPGVILDWEERHPDEQLPEWFVGAVDLKPEDHVSAQAALQKYVDSSISKTVNCPADYTEEQVSDIYMMLFESGCKGGTIYRDGSRYEQILSVPPKDVEQDKYKDWICAECGNTEYTLVENCPMCNNCGFQACSIGGH